MPQDLIGLLVAILLFAILAYALYWVCTTFLASFPPALWICGVILLIIILYWAAGRFAGPLPRFR
jgi:hypothetical protein